MRSKKLLVSVLLGAFIAIGGVWYANNQAVLPGAVVSFGWKPYSMYGLCVDSKYTHTGFPLATWQNLPDGSCASEENAATRILNYVLGALVGASFGYIAFALASKLSGSHR